MFGVHGSIERNEEGVINARTLLVFIFDVCLWELEVHTKWLAVHKA